MKVAVVGGGLTGLAAAYQARQEGLEVHLYEATQRLGGLIDSRVDDDFTVLEGGAESSLRSKPELLSLVEELELQDEVISTIPENLGSYIVRDGQLHPIPRGVRLMAPSLIWPFLRSGLLSWPGKLRVLLDLVLPRRDASIPGREESLAEFVSRRLGVEVLHYLAQPMVAGIYGADPKLLSLEATMPLFPRLEQEHGSVIAGLRQMGSEGEATGARYNLFFSLRQGFGQVIQALVESLPTESLHLGGRVDRVEPVRPPEGSVIGDGCRWLLKVRGGPPEGLEYDGVILALPAPQASALLKPFAPEASKLLSSIVYRPAVTVNLSYDIEAYEMTVPPAYGFVVPAQERRPLLACTFSSRKWPGRESDQRRLLRTYFGGPNMEWALSAQDEELKDLSMSQLAELIGLDEEPLSYEVHRYPIGLPEYRVGHRRLVQELRDHMEFFPTMGLAGNYLDGVGLPDCVSAGRKASRRLKPTLLALA